METVYNGNVQEIENVGLPNECQEHCANDNNCKGFVHQYSNRTCWIMNDTDSIFRSNSRIYIGPKNCSNGKGNNSCYLCFSRSESYNRRSQHISYTVICIHLQL